MGSAAALAHARSVTSLSAQSRCRLARGLLNRVGAPAFSYRGARRARSERQERPGAPCGRTQGST